MHVYYKLFCPLQVMCMVGKDKGKIGTVAVVYRDANEVVLENLNVVCLYCSYMFAFSRCSRWISLNLIL